MKQYNVGDVVFISEKTNPAWAGLGTVKGFEPWVSVEGVAVKMLTGLMTGKEGSFNANDISLAQFIPVTREELKAYDVVRLTRVAKSYENGWENSWVSDMTNHVGKVGIVYGVGDGKKDVNVSFSGDKSTWGYPDFCLEKLTTEVPLAAVKTPVSTPIVASRARLSEARAIALELARKNPLVNADLVQTELTKRGLGRLGNAAGNLFYGKNWKNTNTTVQSTQGSARGRRIIVWEYTGDLSTSVTKSVQATPQNVKVGTRVALGPGYKCTSDQSSVGVPLVVTEIRQGLYPVRVRFEDGPKKGSYGLCSYAELVLL